MPLAEDDALFLEVATRVVNTIYIKWQRVCYLASAETNPVQKRELLKIAKECEYMYKSALDDQRRREVRSRRRRRRNRYHDNDEGTIPPLPHVVGGLCFAAIVAMLYGFAAFLKYISGDNTAFALLASIPCLAIVYDGYCLALNDVYLFEGEQGNHWLIADFFYLVNQYWALAI